MYDQVNILLSIIKWKYLFHHLKTNSYVGVSNPITYFFSWFCKRGNVDFVELKT